MSDESDEEQTEDATAKGKARPCCTEGERHRWRTHRKYVYKARPDKRSGSAGREWTGSFTVARLPNNRGASFEPRPEVLCLRGHWTRDPSEAWRIVSEREAENLVRRLNAGLPIHRDRWLGIGAIVLVAAEVTQAVRAIWPDTAEITVEAIHTLP